MSVPCLFCLSGLEFELNLDIFIFREGVQCNWKYIEGTRYTGVNNTHVCDNTMTKTNIISTAYGVRKQSVSRIDLIIQSRLLSVIS